MARVARDWFRNDVWGADERKAKMEREAQDPAMGNAAGLGVPGDWRPDLHDQLFEATPQHAPVLLEGIQGPGPRLPSPPPTLRSAPAGGPSLIDRVAKFLFPNADELAPEAATANGAPVPGGKVSPAAAGQSMTTGSGTSGRSVTAADLGLRAAKLDKLKGTVTDAGTTRIVTVDDIAGVIPPSELRGAVGRMVETARSGGVEVLQIDARLANPALARFMSREVEKFGGTVASEGERETFTFMLKKKP